MTALLAAGAGATFGLGLWLGLQAIRGTRVLPRARDLVPRAIPPERAIAYLAAALLSGLVVGMLTGWPVAGMATALAILFAPAAVGGEARRRAEVARAEAIATWAELVRDTMAGAAGLEEALAQTAAVAPDPIAPELRAFAARLRHQGLEEALSALASDLAHPSADLVTAALLAATRLEARDLGGLLSRLSEAIRADVRMRARVEVGRARIRTSARIALAATAATIAFLLVFAPHLLAAYDTPAGQAWLVVVTAVFFGAGWLLHRYAQLEVPERFALRRPRGVS